MLGADHRGQRLNTMFRENIDEAAIVQALDPLLAAYAAQRGDGEGFGDFLVRSGAVAASGPAAIAIALLPAMASDVTSANAAAAAGPALSASSAAGAVP